MEEGIGGLGRFMWNKVFVSGLGNPLVGFVASSDSVGASLGNWIRWRGAFWVIFIDLRICSFISSVGAIAVNAGSVPG